MKKNEEILIYQDEDGKTHLEVHLEQNTIWLTQNQIAELFKIQRPAITKHISNVFKTNELQEKSVSSKMELTAEDGKKYKTKLYNLDMVISVGYRVNSKRATQFRIWATQTLREHLVKGYTLNEKRLAEQQDKLQELNHAIDFIKSSVARKELQSDEAKGLLDIISRYTRSFILLNQFDNNTLSTVRLNKHLTYEITYDEAVLNIIQLRDKLIEKQEAGLLFGKQKDDSFSGILQSIVQTFDGIYLYPAIEEQAAHLLYFVIKSHPFADGNKRIGAFLFIWFLQRNRHLLRASGDEKINDNTLVALALLVAQSDPLGKDLMIKLIINLINE